MLNAAFFILYRHHIYSFPREYPINKECVWEIIAPENHKITLNFTHFDLEGNAFYQPAACEYDAGELCTEKKKEFLYI